ncbi:MAG: DUF309 domain-containing protein [Gemmataceae bacterium]
MSSTPPRLVAELSFPAARYVPGITHEVPRPTPLELPDRLDMKSWPRCRPYLFGIDLFNHGYYWEAHEVWEGLWNQAGRTGPQADFLKALIQLGAAGVKHVQGHDAGRRSNASRARHIFSELQTILGANFLGLALKELAQLAESCAEQGWPEPPPLLSPNQRG